MRIAKYLNHLGVDGLLKGALGDELTIFRFNDSTGWIGRDQIDFDYEDGDIRDQDWDIFVFDDPGTVAQYLSQPTRARAHVWYCHGTFHAWTDAQKFFNREFADLPVSVIFTDEYKRTMVDQWREFPVVSTLIQPIALPDHKFQSSPVKNGRYCVVGNDYHRICQIYPRYTILAEPAIGSLMAYRPDRFDVFGWNGGSDGEIFGDLRRGSVAIKDLAAWSASVHLSGVASIGFVLAECFAAAIPVVATAKYQLPDDGSWIKIDTVEEMIDAVDGLVRNPDLARSVGLAGQQMFRDRFGINAYQASLRDWLQSLL